MNRLVVSPLPLLLGSHAPGPHLLGRGHIGMNQERRGILVPRGNCNLHVVVYVSRQFTRAARFRSRVRRVSKQPIRGRTGRNCGSNWILRPWQHDTRSKLRDSPRNSLARDHGCLPGMPRNLVMMGMNPSAHSIRSAR